MKHTLVAFAIASVCIAFVIATDLSNTLTTFVGQQLNQWIP